MSLPGRLGSLDGPGGGVNTSLLAESLGWGAPEPEPGPLAPHAVTAAIMSTPAAITDTAVNRERDFVILVLMQDPTRHEGAPFHGQA
ncbi:hypothetical protein Pen01_78720 [Phytomonospora endophytica]|nr:hypothetical protein Pen01_78720 [Phytomonospora endophytica]